MPTRTLYLIRHGQYKHDPDDPHEGSLTTVGRKQVKRLARRLRGLPIHAIHCSTLRRAEETARILASEFPGLDVHPVSILQECVPGVPTAYSDYIARQYSAEMIRDGERQAEVAFRRYFRRTHGDDRADVIVAHGNIIRYLVCRALSLPGRPPTRSWCWQL